MATPRLPAHLEVSGLIRQVQTAGGFATVLQKGERDAGIVLLLTTNGGQNIRLWERMPQLDGSRTFTETKAQSIENTQEFDEYIRRRMSQDPDAWVLELDIADAERFIDSAAD
ncbi:MAG: DUF1491 domain-containing protein [Citromicrobium sp.]|nr:MAG: DUF1491 domain-containing protein [Citromicrobium sp.]